MQSSFTKESSDTLSSPTSTSLKFFKQYTKKVQHLKQNQTVTNRTATHVIVILVAILAIGLSNLELAWGTISAVRPLKYDPAEPANSPSEEGLSLSLPTQLSDAQDDVLIRAAVPRTIIPAPPSSAGTQIQQPAQTSTLPQIKTYAVESGDTLSGIAEKFDIRVETIVWSNQALQNNPDLLYVGQELTILPVDGVYHQVGSGDSIEGIAAVFKVDPQAIIDYPLNELDPNTLIIQPGQWLVVPNGNKPFVPRTVIAYSGPVPDNATLGSGIFGWPTSGRITQGYFGFHPGLDIGGWQGAPILAADSGHVVVAGWDNTGYGNMVVIDHGNGFQTVYAHLNSYYVEQGSDVAKGQQIGEMGNTGNSTGSHLHFEIRQGTIQRNPYGFLP